MILDDLILM